MRRWKQTTRTTSKKLLKTAISPAQPWRAETRLCPRQLRSRFSHGLTLPGTVHSALTCCGLPGERASRRTRGWVGENDQTF